MQNNNETWLIKSHNIKCDKRLASSSMFASQRIRNLGQLDSRVLFANESKSTWCDHYQLSFANCPLPTNQPTNQKTRSGGSSHIINSTLWPSLLTLIDGVYPIHVLNPFSFSALENQPETPG